MTNDQIPMTKFQFDLVIGIWSLVISSLRVLCVLRGEKLLSASNERHDFEAVAFAEDCLAMLSARHHFEVQFDRHMRLRDAQLAQ
jgi:hypothetical protein